MISNYNHFDKIIPYKSNISRQLCWDSIRTRSPAVFWMADVSS